MDLPRWPQVVPQGQVPPAPQVPGYSAAEMRRLAEPYFWPKAWHASAARGSSWVQSYDGPDAQQCEEANLTPWWQGGGAETTGEVGAVVELEGLFLWSYGVGGSDVLGITFFAEFFWMKLTVSEGVGVRVLDTKVPHKVQTTNATAG
eukprot:Skav216035  [mRNA]  locus=scaffold2403:59870:60310:- [translate_table: standard]